MTEQEFEQLQRRFGPDVSLWPAPYRQEAARFAGDASIDEDEALDRLVLEAAASETNEVALTRKVMATINDEQRPTAFADGFRQLLSMPAAATGFAALLLVAALGGYMAASDAPDGLDDALLAFTLGGDGAGIFDDLNADGLSGEEQL